MKYYICLFIALCYSLLSFCADNGSRDIVSFKIADSARSACQFSQLETNNPPFAKIGADHYTFDIAGNNHTGRILFDPVLERFTILEKSETGQTIRGATIFMNNIFKKYHKAEGLSLAVTISPQEEFAWLAIKLVCYKQRKKLEYDTAKLAHLNMVRLR